MGDKALNPIIQGLWENIGYEIQAITFSDNNRIAYIVNNKTVVAYDNRFYVTDSITNIIKDDGIIAWNHYDKKKFLYLDQHRLMKDFDPDLYLSYIWGYKHRRKGIQVKRVPASLSSFWFLY